MVSVKNAEDSCISSSAPVPVMLPSTFKSLKRDGLKQLKGGKSNEPEKYVEQALYAKAYKTSIENHPSITGCPPVKGRTHTNVQTDLYLEELTEIVQEKDVECQTDPLLDRPASPLFIPRSSGTDVETQIYPDDIELFNFDREVQPLLECIVGETIEQSLIEISAEENIYHLEEQQKEFEIRRNVEVAECLRLEEEEKRLVEEKRRRLKEQDEAIQLEEEMAKKIAACIFAQDYLSDLLPRVYRRLERQGYFVTQDIQIQEIEEDFWPWLIDEVDSEIATLQASCNLIDSLIEDSAHKITEEAVIKPVKPTVYPERVKIEVEKQKESVVMSRKTLEKSGKGTKRRDKMEMLLEMSKSSINVNKSFMKEPTPVINKPTSYIPVDDSKTNLESKPVDSKTNLESKPVDIKPVLDSGSTLSNKPVDDSKLIPRRSISYSKPIDDVKQTSGSRSISYSKPIDDMKQIPDDSKPIPYGSETIPTDSEPTSDASEPTSDESETTPNKIN